MNIFVAGPRAVSRLNHAVKGRLQNIINNDFTILVGDANGIDKQVQSYCHSLGYNKVIVFASNGKVRNNVGNWEIEKVVVGSDKKAFDFYAAKDEAMAIKADYGFMIWNGKSRGTLNNMYNLVKLNKTVLVYLIPDQQFYTIKSIADIEQLSNKENVASVLNHSKDVEDISQLSLF